MPTNRGVKVNVVGFPQLNAAAKLRVQAALHTALQNELVAAGHNVAAEGIFGDGSIRGGRALRAAGTRTGQ
jgi:hypothetical protein